MIHECLPYIIGRTNEALIFDAYYTYMLKFLINGKIDNLHMPKNHYERLVILMNVLAASKDAVSQAYRGRSLQAAKTVKMTKENRQLVLRENIFDLFDGFFTYEESTKAKSIFDDLLT
jgi:hypothetical protein